MLTLTQSKSFSNPTATILLLSSATAFIISSVAVIWGYVTHFQNEIDWRQNVESIIHKLKIDTERVRDGKLRKQKIGFGIFILGTILLMASIATIIYISIM